MGLDLNEKEKGALPRVVLKAHQNCGNQFAGGVYDSSMFTEELEREEFLQMGFYFPVDCVIWDAGIQVAAAVNTNNDRSDVAVILDSRTKQPTNAEGVVRVGMQFFSPRDKLYASVEAGDDKGSTPWFPATKAKRDNKGDQIDWAVNDGASDEIPLHSSPGWLNKSNRMQLIYKTMTTSGGSREYNVNFTRKIGKKSKGFKVEAGTMLVYYVYNNSGASNSDRELKLQIEAIPRVNFFPLKDIVQNLEYNNRSEARWGANHRIELTTQNGHGVNRLFTRPIIVEGQKP